jgi:hypothetical protein
VTFFLDAALPPHKSKRGVATGQGRRRKEVHMRRILLTVIACCAVIAVVPGAALAHGGHHHHKRHHHHAHHATVRQFGHDQNQGGVQSQDQNAGTVTSFTGGVLTITLNNGQMVSGDVTTDTEIECEGMENDNSSLRSHDSHGDNGGGDDNGDNDQGDDNNDNDENNAGCSSADLTPGTVVHEAELKLSSAGAVWNKVELVTASAADNDNDDD